MSTITINPGANIQNVIDSAPSGSTIVFTPGIYNVSQVIDLKSGVSLEGQPGAELQSNGSVGIFRGQGVQDITISGLTFDGHNGGPGVASGAIYLDSSTGDTNGTPSNNIHILNNTFQNWANSDGLYLWSTQNTYVEGNTLKNGYEGISWATDPGTPALNNLVISGNVITGMARMGIETAFSSTLSNIHIDYNTISNIGDMSISFVEGQTGGNFLSGTVWGNHIDGANSGGTLVELGNYGGPANITVAQNVLSNHEWGMMFSHTSGMAVLDNTFINVQNPFSDDGGYDGTEWIGANTVDGVSQSGWSYHGPYGTQPTLYSPSTPPSGVTSVGSVTSTVDTMSTAGTTPTTDTTSSAGTTTTADTSTVAGTTTTADTSTVAGTTTTADTSTVAGTTMTADTTTTAGTTTPADTTTVAGATTAADTTTAAGTTTATSTTDPLQAPVQQNTLLGSFGTTAGFLQNTASTSQDSVVVSGTQGGGGSGSLSQLLGGQLTADLTNIGSLSKILTGGGSFAGTGTQTETVSGIGAAFSSWDQSGKPHDSLNHDTWRHS
jgi:parallel beta-helix repeat protein